MTDVSKGSPTAPRQLPRRTLNLCLEASGDEGKARVLLASSALTRPSPRSRSKDAATASSTPSTHKYRASKRNITIKSTCFSYAATSKLSAIMQIFNAWPSRTSIKSSKIFTSRWAVILCAFSCFSQLTIHRRYYSGQKTAPILTIVIGGNHEASNYMWELFVSSSHPHSPKCLINPSSYHGGWLAPNIYFLGHAGSVLVNGIRVSGASGIFKSHDFPLGSHPSLDMS